MRRGLLLLLVLPALGCGFVEIRLRPGVGHERSDDGGGGEQPAEPGQRPQPSPSPAERKPGRQGDEYILDKRWAPLEKIVERLPIPGMSNTAATTISPNVYVVDLDEWLAKHPPNQPLFDSIMLHEQLHALRQEKTGVDDWVDRYLIDREFMWAEEQLGWYEQIRHLRSRGQRLIPEAIAKNLSRYRNLRGSMISYEEALKWVQDVMASRWRPQ